MELCRRSYRITTVLMLMLLLLSLSYYQERLQASISALADHEVACIIKHRLQLISRAAPPEAPAALPRLSKN